MLIRWTKSQCGTVINEKGVDYKGNHIDVPCLLKDGEHYLMKLRGFIDATECDSFQRVKLLGFTGYSADEGRNWVSFDTDSYVIGVIKWNEFYVVLFEGVPRSLPYIPKKPARYYNNVFDISAYR
ncbi:hypothetical protein [Vibrio atypicus]|uniref:hypothetical protein n=1 Tax=Vibrio atypicus TaxID=558271 RepID=UPI001357E4E7|nr:hypothetical protein [Vibrio atypicus]